MRVDLGSGEEGMKNGKRRLSPRKTSAIWAPQATRPLPSRVPLCPGKAGSRLGGKAEDGEGLAASTGRTGGASSGHGCRVPVTGARLALGRSGPSLRGCTLGACRGVRAGGRSPAAGQL